ncbi:5376_t:CDS:1, partial [Dentiscutata heterogama]
IVMTYTSIVPIPEDPIYDPVLTEKPNTTVAGVSTKKALPTDNNTLPLDKPIPIDTNKHSN